MNTRLLNINILDHPTNRLMTVFFYEKIEHAEYFREMLNESGISFEYQIDEESGKHYFGIMKSHDKMTKKLNYLVFARFRKPFIDSSIGKAFLIGITLLFIILALIGYIQK